MTLFIHYSFIHSLNYWQNASYYEYWRILYHIFLYSFISFKHIFRKASHPCFGHTPWIGHALVENIQMNKHALFSHVRERCHKT